MQRSRFVILSSVGLVSVGLLAVACSSSDDSGGGSPAVDSGTGNAVDSGSVRDATTTSGNDAGAGDDNGDDTADGSTITADDGGTETDGDTTVDASDAGSTDSAAPDSGASGYTIGGNAHGIAGGTLVLRDTLGDAGIAADAGPGAGADSLSLMLDGPFTFGAHAQAGNYYNVTIGSMSNGRSCFVTSGAGQVSAANVTNVAVDCYYYAGYPTAFTSNTGFGGGSLLGYQITLTGAGTLKAFGVLVSSNPANGQFALYSNNGGIPGTLLASSAGTALVTGTNEVAPTATNVSLAAGSYWLMGIYSSTTRLVEDVTTSATMQTIDYVTLAYGSTLPTTFPTATTYQAVRYNAYIKLE